MLGVMYPLHLYLWHHTCPRTGRRRTTAWRCTEAGAKARLIDAEAVPGSLLLVTGPTVGHGQHLCSPAPRTGPPAPPGDPSCR